MATMAENVIIAGAENRPPMLKKGMYDSWKTRIWLYIKGKENGDMLINSIKNGPFQLNEDITIPAIDVDIYTLNNHYQTAKEIWDQVKELMEGTELTLQERESKLYDEFDRFTYEPPVVQQHSPAPSTQLGSGFVVPSFLPTDDPIASLNKAMLFLSSTISLRFPPTNNQGHTVNTGKSQATGTRAINTVRDVNANQPRAIRCYNCKGEGHMAKQCTARKRVKDSEWFRGKMLLAQAQEAKVVLHEDQQDFLADRLEEMEDRSINGDIVGPAYDSNIISKIVEIVLWYLDSGCSKHMTGQRDKLINFVSKLSVGITHHTYVQRTLQQNDVVERRNRTLVEAARTMLIFSKSPLFLWAEVVATACYTQNRSLIYTRYNKTLYELLIDRKPDLKHLHVFGALCYPTNDSEDLGKLKPKVDIGIFIGYSPSKKAYWIYSKRTRMIMETIHDSYKTMMLQHQLNLLQRMIGICYFNPCSMSTLNLQVLSLQPLPLQLYFYQIKLELLPLLPFDTIDQDAPSPSTSPNNETTASPIHSTNVEEPNKEEDAVFDSDTFTNPFAPPVTSSTESSSRIVDTSNMHTFQQPHTNTRRWTNDHPLVTIIDNPSKSVLTRRQLTTDALWCYFHAFLTKVEPKNYKESMKESCWIEAIQEEIYEFERLEVWELVPRPSNVMLINLRWKLA
ncbi:integrase, catalytic region, zinc finger, CCHC-type containing protein [Tanacetum coccineum]